MGYGLVPPCVVAMARGLTATSTCSEANGSWTRQNGKRATFSIGDIRRRTAERMRGRWSICVVD